MKTSLHHLASRRVAAWQGEWEFLQRSLAREPGASQAWWWKIRLRVLAYVIVRYGADPAVRALDHLPEPRASSGDFTFAERRTVEPRPREALGAHLKSIAEANDFQRPLVPRDDDARFAREPRVGVRFAVGAVLASIAGAAIAIVGGGNIEEICALAGAFCVAGGMLAAILVGPLSERIADWLTKE